MKVFKFGGGTLKTADAIRAMTEIMSQESKVFVVVSAFSKMTNLFEVLLNSHQKSVFEATLSVIEDYHRQLIKGLFPQPENIIEAVLMPIIREISATSARLAKLSSDQAYDQLVSYGEVLSSSVISAYWKKCGMNHQFLHATEIIQTDDTWKDARVDMESTAKRLNKMMDPDCAIYLTQGFIGSHGGREVTTLGREGSDYTAAIIGSLLQSEEVVIWKDVPGVMTADPAEFDDPGQLSEISYLEAVELSYFGAKVIHPNTIKPLHNRGIPLVVKSLYSPVEAGTRIIAQTAKKPDPPIVIKKADQVLLSLQPRDFSFIFEEAISRIFGLLAGYKIRINLMQHGAVSLSLVFDRDPDKLDRLTNDLQPEFKVLYNTGLDLWTIRHYDEMTIERITRNKQIYVQQKSRSTARYVLG